MEDSDEAEKTGKEMKDNLGILRQCVSFKTVLKLRIPKICRWSTESPVLVPGMFYHFCVTGEMYREPGHLKPTVAPSGDCGEARN